MSPPWWQNAVVYEIYVRSFADSDGDGVGDLPGIAGRLEYLRDLGVDAIWLTPFYRSPMADHGYDVADPRDVDPLFGTLAAADALLARAHDLGLRVIVDIVPNHTSSAHPWFVEALAAPPGAPARGRYVFREGRGADGSEPPNDWESVFGGPAWTRVRDGQWYLHLFAPEQPDLEWTNPEVAAEYASVLRFWLDRGVDGFRIDVAHGLLKAPGLPDAGADQRPDRLADRRALPQWDQDGVHEVYRGWRRIADGYPGDRVLVGEAWVNPVERLARYVRPAELHQAFNFEFLQTPWDATALRATIEGGLSALGAVGAPATWVLSNHDVIRHRTRYAPGAGPEVSLARARAAVLLLLALPGCAYLYQGEELGLEEVDLPDEVLVDPVWERSGRTERGRDGERVPLPWSGSTPPFGFSPAGSAAPWLPMPEDWKGRTVADQRADPASIWTLYRDALALRRGVPALAGTGLEWADAPEGVLLFGRRGEEAPAVRCAVNLGLGPVALDVPGEVLIASGPVTRTEAGLVLPPDTAVWCASRLSRRRDPPAASRRSARGWRSPRPADGSAS
jgi:alpha-glucosidase